jgi:hypothetical protein
MGRLQREVNQILGGQAKRGSVPELWDGHAGERIAELLEYYVFEGAAQRKIHCA